MKKVVLYPFNKITQGLIRFKDLLDFEIAGVIEFALNVGEDAGKLTDGNPSNIKITDNIKEGLQGADTLVLNDPGTTFEGNEGLFKKYDIVNRWRQLIITANEMGIEVISIHEIFDADTKKWIKENNVSIKIGKKYDKEIMDRLNLLDVNDSSVHHEIYEYLQSFKAEKELFVKTKIKKIAVMAVRGCLGKFTTQMTLYRALKNAGKKTAAIVTEPTAFLFNSYDADIPKFLSQKPLLSYPYYINELVKKADKDGYDYILLSGQGSLQPYGCIKLDAVKMATLSAFHADVTMLVVGYEDNDVIRDCIDLMRIYGNHTPIALLLPDKVQTEYGHYENKTKEQVEERKKELREKFGIQNIELIRDIDKITDLII